VGPPDAEPLAELEFFHSRHVAPTRRVALGDSDLPCEPAPGFGGVLLGGVVAANRPRIADDDVAELTRLTRDLEAGLRIAQPRLRYRFQVDRVGLLRARARLVHIDNQLEFEFDDDRSSPIQRTLAACYAAGQLEVGNRRVVFAAIRRGLRWAGPVGPSLIASLSGAGGGHPLTAMAMDDPIGWALGTLGFDRPGVDPLDGKALPQRDQVQHQFRRLLRGAHPDHGGDTADAAQRIADLREARRILLAG